MEYSKEELGRWQKVLEEEEERVRQERISVEKYLDNLELERLEWERMQNDMYPGVKPEQEED